MKRLYVIALIAALLAAVIAVPVFTQDGNDDECDIDLSDVAVLLIQAQDAAGSGDTTTALNILGEAEAEIGALRDACGGALGRFNTFTTSDDAFRFNYPGAWVFSVENRNTFVMGTSDEALELFFAVDPTFGEGMQAVAVLIGEARQVGGERGDDLPGILSAYQANLGELGYEMESPLAFEINGQRALRIDFGGDGFASSIIGVELQAEDTFAVLVATAAQGEFDALDPVLLDIAASIEEAPVPPPPPIVLGRTFVFEDNVAAFNYPEAWIIGEEDNFSDSSTVILGSSQAALDATETDVPALPAGQQALFVVIGDSDEIINTDGEDLTLDELLDQFTAEALPTGVQFSEIVRLDYDGIAAGEFSFVLGSVDASLQIIELRPRRTYAMMIILGGVGTRDENIRLLRAIAESFSFPPNADPLGEASIQGDETADDTAEAVEATEAVPEAETQPDIELVNLGDTHTIGMFSFDYPEAWTLGESEEVGDGLITSTTIGTRFEAIEALNETDPVLSPGDQAIGILTGSPDELGAEGDTPEGVLNAVVSGALEDTGYEFSAQESLQINGRDSAQVRFTGAEFDGVAIVVTVAPDVYVMLIGGAASGEGDDLYAVARSIAESVVFLGEVESTPEPDDVLPTRVVVVTATPAPPTQIPMPTPTAPPVAVDAQVSISEVVAPGDITAEAVVFMNEGSTIDMSNWVLSDEDGNEYVFPGGRRLFAAASFTLSTRAGTNTAIQLFWDLDEAVFDSGETLTLTDASGSVQATFTVP